MFEAIITCRPVRSSVPYEPMLFHFTRRRQNSCPASHGPDICLPPRRTATIPCMQSRGYDIMYNLETTYRRHTGMMTIMEQLLTSTFGTKNRFSKFLQIT